VRHRHLRRRQQDVLARFGITWNLVERIEREGMDNDWPPLGGVE